MGFRTVQFQRIVFYVLSSHSHQLLSSCNSKEKFTNKRIPSSRTSSACYKSSVYEQDRYLSIYLTLCKGLITLSTSIAASDFYLGVYGEGALSSSTNRVSEGTNKKNTDLGSVGETLGLSIGHEVIRSNNLVTAVEVFGALHSYDAIQDSQLGAVALNTKVKMKYSFGTAFKIGYKLNQAIVFSKVGYINSRFEYSSDYAGASSSSVNNRNSSGFLFGLGIDLKLTDRVSAGLSYDYAVYRSQDYAYSAFGIGTIMVSNVFKARMHFVGVGVKYKI